MAFQAIDFKRNVFRWKKSFSMASKFCFIFSWEEDFVAKNRTRESREHIALSPSYCSPCIFVCWWLNRLGIWIFLLIYGLVLLVFQQIFSLSWIVSIWTRRKHEYNWISWNISRRSSLQICASVLQINFNRVVSGLDYWSVQKPHFFFLISFYSAAGSEELCLSFPRCGKSAYFFFRLILR